LQTLDRAIALWLVQVPGVFIPPTFVNGKAYGVHLGEKLAFKKEMECF
jgi:hypothetical protein